MLSDVDYFLRDLSRGMARIQVGETPDGSGNSLGGNGVLGDYFFLPGRSSDNKDVTLSGQLGFGGSGPGGTLTFSSTSNSPKGVINFGHPAIRMTINETDGLVGINCTPAAALHIEPGGSGTTTLTPSSLVNSNWDGNRTGPGGTPNGAFSAASVNVNDDDANYCGVDPGVLGTNTQRFGLNGTVTAGKTWTVNIRVRTLGGTASDTGNMEFHIIDSAGNKFQKIGPPSLLGLTTTWTTFSFTLDCSGSPTGSGTANSVEVGLQCVQSGPTSLYTCCTYIEITTGGDSDLVRWNSSPGTLLGKIDKDGKVGIGTDGDSLGALLTAESDAAASVVSIFKGATSQSGNLTEWQSQAGAILSRIKSDGTFDGPITTTGAVAVTDSTFSILDDATPSKIAKFQCATISAATTRTFTFPDANGTLALTSDIDTARTWTTLQTFRDTTWKLVDDGDVTKTAVFSLGGASAGADLTLAWNGTADRTVTLPNATGLIPTVENAATITGEWTFDGVSAANDMHINLIPGGAGIGTGAFAFIDTGSGFGVEFTFDGVGLSGNQALQLPDASGILVLTGGVQTLGAKTLSTTCILKVQTATIGVSFEDQTVATKKLRVVLSSAVGNNSLVFVNTAAREYRFGDTGGNCNVVLDDGVVCVDDEIVIYEDNIVVY